MRASAVGIRVGEDRQSRCGIRRSMRALGRCTARVGWSLAAPTNPVDRLRRSTFRVSMLVELSARGNGARARRTSSPVRASDYRLGVRGTGEVSLACVSIGSSLRHAMNGSRRRQQHLTRSRRSSPESTVAATRDQRATRARPCQWVTTCVSVRVGD